MVIVRSKLNQHWRGDRYEPGDEMPATEEQAERLTKSGQAYYDFKGVPTMNDKKDEIIEYLESEGIEYNEYMTKSELLELC